MRDKAKMTIWYLCLAATIASFSYAAYRYGHPMIAIVIAVVPGALIANGIIAEAEDNAPDGFMSEKGTKKRRRKDGGTGVF